MSKKPLSERQKNILNYILKYGDKKNRPPTIREIGKATNITSTSVVNYNLMKLKERGMVDREPEVSRGLRLTKLAYEFLGFVEDKVNEFETNIGLVRIPLKGNIVAGEPIEVETDVYDDDDAVELGSNMLPDNTENLFALRVSGDSMIDAMVNDGDIVVMQHQQTAENGEMVAVWLTPSDTTTLKYFFHEGGKIRLQPANPTYEPIYVNPENVRIQGRVMMVVRNTA